MDALRTVGDFWEVWIYFLQIDIVLVRSAHSWDIDLTHENRFNVFAHLRIILFFYYYFVTAWTQEKRFVRYDSWVMCGECYVFFYGMCWNNENNILTVYNAEKFESFSKLFKTGRNKEWKHLCIKCWASFSLKGCNE